MPQHKDNNEERIIIEDRGAALVFMAFILGALAGATAVLLTTPESGPVIRRRLGRGLTVAKDELGDAANEAMGTFESLRSGTVEAMKQTGSRLSKALEATKDALTADEKPQPPVRPVRGKKNAKTGAE